MAPPPDGLVAPAQRLPPLLLPLRAARQVEQAGGLELAGRRHLLLALQLKRAVHQLERLVVLDARQLGLALHPGAGWTLLG